MRKTMHHPDNVAVQFRNASIIPFLLGIVLSDRLGHLLIRLHDQWSHVIAILAVIGLAGVASSLIVKICATADRADLADLFWFHEEV